MKKIILIICLFGLLCSCTTEDELSSFSKLNGIDMPVGTVVSSYDTHGGLHGDGESLLVVQYSDDSLCYQMEKSEYWHKLPLSDNLNICIYQTYADSLSIPEIQNGYYYFYDRNTESTNPYDDTDLLNRYSYNFTFAIYDQDYNQLYLCQCDT
jgi:hypothetical protein